MRLQNVTKTAAWTNLKKHYREMKDDSLRELFQGDPKRFERYFIELPLLSLDYSKNRMTDVTKALLVQLAEEANMPEKIEAQFAGDKINTTEDRAVLHTALRGRAFDPVERVLEKMRDFSEKVRNGTWRGFTGKPITDVVNIGIGGSDLGPKMVCHALNHYAKASLKTHFVSNIDGTQMVETLKHLNPETTLFIVASKTFTTIETLTNAATAREWLLKSLRDPLAVAKHFVAISTNAEKVKAFGIDPENMFIFWDWVGGRYSVWSAIGLIIAIAIGVDYFERFLAGAKAMDHHFRQAPFDQNIPVLMALLGVWYRNFFGTTSQAIIPYDQYLYYFPAYLQQLDMESNGKSVMVNGKAVKCATGPVIWGGIGTDCQHSFHQLLHQGTDLIPVDFVIPRQSLNPIGAHHPMLFSNCLAQSQALLQGKTEEEAYQELIAKGMSARKARRLAPHKVMPGNRPSNTLVFEKLTPEVVGALIALYEHKVFVQGAIWQINSFDQWGVELGKQLAGKITPYLTGENNATFEGDSSTRGLIQWYKKG